MLRLALIAIAATGSAATPPASPADSSLRIKNLKTLCVVYRGDPAGGDHMSDHDVEMARNGAELARLFYFRNSGAKLNCELHWLVVDAAPPATEGPTMDHIEADLRERGVEDGQFDGVFVTGIGLAGNWGGFELLGGAGACFGGHGNRGNLEWYPADDGNVAYGTAWNFAHEYQHAIDLVIAENSGHPDLLHAHPYADRNEKFFKGFYQGGEHWDWIACTFREFEAWLELKGATNSFIESADADEDGLPDDDPRLPIDEQRFGSNPGKKDTDSDGLDDLHEFTADRYAGSDPTKPDTDGDGMNDGVDEYPLIAIRPTIPFGKPATLLDSAFARNDEGGKCTVAAAWETEGLQLEFAGPRRFRVHLKIDGSATNGFWEGGDTYLLRVSPGAEGGGTVELNGLGLSGPIRHARVKVAEKDGAFSISLWLPAELGQGVSKEINYGGKRDAADVMKGLTLTPGRMIAFNIGYEFEDGRRALLTPLHTMYASRLAGPDKRINRPLLRAPAESNERVPSAEVLGVDATTSVQVETAEGEVVGARVGPGPVLLTGLDGADPVPVAEGDEELSPKERQRLPWTVELVARAGDAVSPPVRMTLDRSVVPPHFFQTRLLKGSAREPLLGVVSVAVCEPGAEFELWWGLAGTPSGPLAVSTARSDGRASVEMREALLDGWLVSAYDGQAFENLVFVDSWPKIDRNFRDGAADDRLPADKFSLRFEGVLMLDRAGPYTLELSSDDGSRLWLDGELLINHWGHHGMSARRATVPLSAGPHRIRIDYYEIDGWAGIRLRGGPDGSELSADLPIRKCPLRLSEVELYGLQTDPFGNRSGFAKLFERGSRKNKAASD